MVLGTLKDSARYEALHPLFARVFAYVKEHDLLHAELGRIELEGDTLFINNVEPATVLQATGGPSGLPRHPCPPGGT